jgi:hypothetical protein
MSGAIPSIPHTPSWRGAQLKETQGQIYFYLYENIVFCCLISLSTTEFKRYGVSMAMKI